MYSWRNNLSMSLVDLRGTGIEILDAGTWCGGGMEDFMIQVLNTGTVSVPFEPQFYANVLDHPNFCTLHSLSNFTQITSYCHLILVHHS